MATHTSEFDATDRSTRTESQQASTDLQAEFEEATAPARPDRLEDPTATGDDQRPPTVLVGIPAYNEAGSIGDVVADANRNADEVLVVDDGSEDETVARARGSGATVMVQGANRGYGATLGEIFQYAHAKGVDHLVTLDGDGQHDPTDIPKLVAAQRSSGAELVVGSRFAGESETQLPGYRQVGLVVVNALTNLGARLRYGTMIVADTQSGYRAYDREAIEAIASADGLGEGMGASIDILFRAAEAGFETTEVPTTIEYDVEEPSSKHPLAHGLVLLSAIFGEVLPRPAIRTDLGIAGVVVLAISAASVPGLFGSDAHTLPLLAVGVAALCGLLVFSGIRSGHRRGSG